MKCDANPGCAAPKRRLSEHEAMIIFEERIGLSGGHEIMVTRVAITIATGGTAADDDIAYVFR